MPVRWSRELPSEPSSVTVITDAAGRYVASFVVAVDDEPLPEIDAQVGIDLGLSTFAVMSDGMIIDSPKFFRRAERKLRKAQQNLSRKQKGSKTRERTSSSIPVPVSVTSTQTKGPPSRSTLSART